MPMDRTLSTDEWESDLAAIIEKTNQNLNLLRKIGDKRTESVDDSSRGPTLQRSNSSLAQRTDSERIRTLTEYSDRISLAIHFYIIISFDIDRLRRNGKSPWMKQMMLNVELLIKSW